MTMSFNHKALGAFSKLGAVALITATIFFTACKQTGGGGGGGKQGAPFVEGGASLILSPDKLNIWVEAKTEDGSAIEVEGCTETTLKSDIQNETELHAKGTKVILKGKITELYCSGNKLTELNVQGCTSLQELFCQHNQLTALNVQGLTSLEKLFLDYNKLPSLNVQGCTALQELYCNSNQLTSLNVQGCTALKKLWCCCNRIRAEAMTKLLNALPAREANDGAEAYLYNAYVAKIGITEDNCKDYTQPADLKAAFDGAKSKNWRLRKVDADGCWEDI